jgi:glutathione S-transferase
VKQQALKKASIGRLAEILGNLDRVLSEHPFLFGNVPMVPDYILAMQTIWDIIFPHGIDEFPNLQRHLNLMKERPAVKRMLNNDVERCKQAKYYNAQSVQFNYGL